MMKITKDLSVLKDWRKTLKSWKLKWAIDLKSSYITSYSWKVKILNEWSINHLLISFHSQLLNLKLIKGLSKNNQKLLRKLKSLNQKVKTTTMTMKMTSLKRRKSRLLQRKRIRVQVHHLLINNLQINLKWLNLNNKTSSLRSKIKKNPINPKTCKT